MNIEGKTALITGGAKRVGRGITLALARAGANVVINYNSSTTEADQTAAEAEALEKQGRCVVEKGPAEAGGLPRDADEVTVKEGLDGR